MKFPVLCGFAVLATFVLAPVSNAQMGIVRTEVGTDLPAGASEKVIEANLGRIIGERKEKLSLIKGSAKVTSSHSRAIETQRIEDQKLTHVIGSYDVIHADDQSRASVKFHAICDGAKFNCASPHASMPLSRDPRAGAEMTKSISISRLVRSVVR